MGAAASRWRGSAVPIAAAVGVAVILVLALAMYLYDHSRRDVIANGVKVDGVPVGGLHASAARAKLQRDLGARLNQPVSVRSGSEKWVLGPREAQVRVNVNKMVDQAVSASREGSILTRTFRGIFAGSVSRDVPLAVSYSHHATRVLAGRVRAAISRPPRDATVQPNGSGLNLVPGQDGRSVSFTELTTAIDRAVAGRAPNRTVIVPVHHVKPAVSTSQLAGRYPAYIVIDRATFKLRFYSHLKLSKSFEIAVGMEGLETPAGLHKVEWEQVNPPWYVPKKAWAGALAGTVVPPGPGDPLKARFMSFEGGAGIHGIDPSEYSSIGHNASHGCVRMRIPDVIDLYSHSPVGTPVYII